MKNKIPKWILALTLIFSLLSIYLAITITLAPENRIPNTDFYPKGIQYILHLWAARQATIGIILGYSAIKKSAPMLHLALLTYLIMNILDAFVAYSQNDMELFGGASVISILLAIMFYVLNKKGIKNKPKN